jgi:type III restriction enzyme
MERKYMAKTVALNPILNNPYIEPASYYATNESGELDYERIAPGRRPFIPDIPPVPVGQGAQKSLIDVEAVSGQYEKHLINRVRIEVEQWRRDGYPNTTRTTRELLRFWFEDSERIDQRKLFFAQREAVESAIWLNEVADRSNPGQNALRMLEERVLRGLPLYPRVTRSRTRTAALPQ